MAFCSTPFENRTNRDIGLEHLYLLVTGVRKG